MAGHLGSLELQHFAVKHGVELPPSNDLWGVWLAPHKGFLFSVGGTPGYLNRKKESDRRHSPRCGAALLG